MSQAQQIEHKGIINDISSRKLDVSIIAASSCASCNLKSACSVSDVQEKIVEVFVDNPGKYRKGEEVNVFFRRSLGFRALLLAYVFPFLLLMACLITISSITQNELLSGIISLTILIPYYAILYFQRDKIKKTFHFSIEKLKGIQSHNIIKV
jgi:positive regulator of sigma E activity